MLFSNVVANPYNVSWKPVPLTNFWMLLNGNNFYSLCNTWCLFLPHRLYQFSLTFKLKVLERTCCARDNLRSAQACFESKQAWQKIGGLNIRLLLIASSITICQGKFWLVQTQLDWEGSLPLIIFPFSELTLPNLSSYSTERFWSYSRILIAPELLP